MTEQAESEVESTGSGATPPHRDRPSQRPADVLRQTERRRRTTPVDASFGERRSGLREKLAKLGITIAMLAGAGALILATHGLGIAPLKGWLAAHHFSFSHFFGSHAAKNVPPQPGFGNIRRRTF